MAPQWLLNGSSMAPHRSSSYYHPTTTLLPPYYHPITIAPTSHDHRPLFIRLLSDYRTFI
ncbi:MAG: hypothetical protein ACI4AW_01695 [Paludibacteraceae bacterium]